MMERRKRKNRNLKRRMMRRMMAKNLRLFARKRS
jgi:hypothetical protein